MSTVSTLLLLPMPSQCDDQAPAHIGKVGTGAMATLLPHIWQGTLAYPTSHGDSREETQEEAAHQEEETIAVLDGCGRLAEAESE